MSDLVELGKRSQAGGLTCLAFHSVHTGTLKGFADFHIIGWHLRIFGCTCHCLGDSRWVQLPSKPLIDKDGQALRHVETGKIRYVPILAFDDNDVLSDAACLALDASHPGWGK